MRKPGDVVLWGTPGRNLTVALVLGVVYSEQGVTAGCEYVALFLDSEQDCYYEPGTVRQIYTLNSWPTLST